MNLDRLKKDLERDEGLRLKPYRCTSDKLTIGIGRNIEDIGVTEDEAYFMLDNDIKRCAHELDRNIEWWRFMPDRAQEALMNMMFNLGWPRLSKFVNMLTALKSGDYDTAANEALDSKWAIQVGARSERVAESFRSCDV